MPLLGDADETRLKLISRLIDEGPQSIAALADGFDISAPANLKTPARDQRRESVWRLESHALDEARRYLDLISKDWDDKLRRLKEMIEEDI
ncbi:MAG TPA: hypothetical protein VIK60_13325 [Vicinamibacterales bacterium]